MSRRFTHLVSALALAGLIAVPFPARSDEQTATAQPRAAAAVAARPDGWAQPVALVPSSPFAGVHGLAIDRAGRLLAGSVIGTSIWEVERRTGTAREIRSLPDGQADDIAIGPRGEIAWTSPYLGEIHLRSSPDAPVRLIARDLPGVNALVFDPCSGALYASQTSNTFTADTLMQIDVAGGKPPRRIASELGSLNGFDVGQDGLIYGPLMSKGQAVRVDPRDGRITVLASGFERPPARRWTARAACSSPMARPENWRAST